MMKVRRMDHPIIVYYVEYRSHLSTSVVIAIRRAHILARQRQRRTPVSLKINSNRQVSLSRALPIYAFVSELVRSWCFRFFFHFKESFRDHFAFLPSPAIIIKKKKIMNTTLGGYMVKQRKQRWQWIVKYGEKLVSSLCCTGFAFRARQIKKEAKLTKHTHHFNFTHYQRKSRWSGIAGIGAYVVYDGWLHSIHLNFYVFARLPARRSRIEHT